MGPAPALDGRISLQKLEILCLVVEVGTVTAAAQQLYVAQPVVTAHLRSLEERLNVKLFQRAGRTLKLTEAGQRVHAWAKETLDHSQQMLDDVQLLRTGEGGSVRMGASMSLGSYRLPVVVASFHRGRPNTDLNMFVSDPETAMAGVEHGDLDFAVSVLTEAPDAALFESEAVGYEDVVLVTSPDGSPQADAISAKDLRKLSIVGTPSGSARRTVVDQMLARRGVRYHSVVEFGHPEAIKRAVMNGLGAALLLRSAVVEELELGQLREIRIRGERLSIPVYLVKRRDKQLSALQLQLRDTIRAHFLEGEVVVPEGLALSGR